MEKIPGQKFLKHKHRESYLVIRQDNIILLPVTPNPVIPLKGRKKMPIVQISMIAGRTPEKKEQLIKKVTDAIVEVLQIPADRVRIVLNEVSKENLGYGGVPLSKLDS